MYRTRTVLALTLAAVVGLAVTPTSASARPGPSQPPGADAGTGAVYVASNQPSGNGCDAIV